MITASRNLLVVLSAFVAAFVVAALGQGAFAALLPVFSARIVGGTDISTYALLVLLALLFFCFGLVVQRWLRGAWPLFWLLLPIVSVYLVAIFGQPGAYRCNPLNTAYVVSCWMVISPFLVSAAATVVGYLAGRGKHGRFVHAV
jgi:hypothetical protein